MEILMSYLAPNGYSVCPSHLAHQKPMPVKQGSLMFGMISQKIIILTLFLAYREQEYCYYMQLYHKSGTA